MPQERHGGRAGQRGEREGADAVVRWVRQADTHSDGEAIDDGAAFERVGSALVA